MRRSPLGDRRRGAARLKDRKDGFDQVRSLACGQLTPVRVTRLVHPDDSRALELKATPAGVRLQRLIMDEILEEEEGLLSDLSAEVRRAIPGVLRKLAQAAANRGKRSKVGCSAASAKENQVSRTTTPVRSA